jgi:hypothetical protein
MRELDPEEFFTFFRMTPECFDELLLKVAPIIQKSSNRESISPGERLAVTLRYDICDCLLVLNVDLLFKNCNCCIMCCRYLASGDSQQSLSYLFRISHQTISKIVTETTAAIWYVLKDEVFEPLTQEFWQRKASEFEAMWQFPMCVGAIDGKHCFVQVLIPFSNFINHYCGCSLTCSLFCLSDCM